MKIYQNKKNYHELVEKSIKKIFESLDTNVTFRELADENNYSAFHFHRVFKGLTGETVKECLKRLRLEKAAYEILRTDKTITEMAFESGYETLEAFTKAFKKAHGISPSRIRKLQDWKGLLYSQAGIHYSPGQRQPYYFFIKPRGGNEMEIKIVNLQPMKLLGLRGTGDYWNMPALWKKFHEILRANKLFSTEAQFLTVFHDHTDDIPQEQKRYDVSISVHKEVSDIDPLSIYQFEGGLYAVLVHVGSCEEIGPVWDKWRSEWLGSSGWKLDKKRPSLEWYQNNPSAVPPELAVTFLCDPVIKE
jgi:AraC family transcriptional regulator